MLSRLAERIKGRFEELKFDLTDLVDHDEEREQALAAREHRFGSFAAQREGAHIKWFIDGKDYLWAVSEALEGARDTIYIEDWWLSPELASYLRRPPSQNEEYRLDRLLQKKAEEGVRVYVVVYKEIEEALTLNSDHTKKTLEALSKNIIVQRHPDHSVGGTFFWAHHEKMCIVDNRLAFIGGLDLCFGRWDTHTHALADFHPNDPNSELWPGEDYSNPRIKDFEHVEKWQVPLIDKRRLARMPWHDVSVGVLGRPVIDIARHFCQRWNFIKHQKYMGQEEMPFLMPQLVAHHPHFQQFLGMQDGCAVHRHVMRTNGVDGTCNAQVLRSSANWSSDIETEHSIQNAYIEAIKNAEHFIYIENQFFITANDEDKDDEIKNQIGAYLVDRIIRAAFHNEPFKVIVLMPLIPAFPADLSSDAGATARLIMHWQYLSICRGGKSIYERLEKEGINPADYITFYSLRSYDRISSSAAADLVARAQGLDPDQQMLVGAAATGSSQRAEMISNADQDWTRGAYSGRQHATSDVYRVPEAYEAEQVRQRFESLPFRETQPASVAHTAMKGQAVPESQIPEDSVDNYVTEELYIHTKLMIVDDRKVIIGSANLNDRSQVGDHDSEIAIMIEDQDMVESRMAGQYYPVSRFATGLRRKLFAEHLGLLPPQNEHDKSMDMNIPPYPNVELDDRVSEALADPLSPNFFQSMWTQTADTNTEVFRNVFHCVPEDSVHNWNDYKNFYPSPDKVTLGHVWDPNMSLQEVQTDLSRVRGHLVHFPLNFLKEVDLSGGINFNTLVMDLYT